MLEEAGYVAGWAEEEQKENDERENEKSRYDDQDDD